MSGSADGKGKAMIKRLVSALLCLLLALSMCACAAIFEKEYVLVEDYVPAAQEDSAQGEKLTVHDFQDLKQTIRDMVNSGQTVGSVIFDSAYDGDVAEDLSDACWQVRTQDALCAYCVVNIFYELNKIVAYYEAQINISYSDYGEKVENIAVLPYSTGLDGIIKELIDDGGSRGAVLINQSTLSAQDMEDMVADVYRRNPAIAPCQPLASVKMYSGTNQQRLYEINLVYSLGTEELEERKEHLSHFAPFTDMDVSRFSEGRRALIAFDYIKNSIAVEPKGQNNTIYSALIERRADSEGIALAYVELCRQLGVECRVVYGQRNWQDHCWNIIRIGESYYHVDAALDAAVPLEEAFMRRDEHIWDICRWDMASYPACTGLLSCEDVLKGRDVIPVEVEKIVDDSPEAESGGNEDERENNLLFYPELEREELEALKELYRPREDKDKRSASEAEDAANPAEEADVSAADGADSEETETQSAESSGIPELQPQ